jgi:dihydroorotate dehydrogenase
MVNGFTLLHALPPETLHRLGLLALRLHLLPPAPQVNYPSLKIETLGLTFPNPIGLAAGFDKNAEAIAPLLRQGFGFVEAGTVTPLPQPGNPSPRIFRLAQDRAVINRLGFNNAGLDAFVRHLQRPRPGIAGANIGKNKDSRSAIGDYVTGLEAAYPHADYITVNISSPNTPGLRSLQARDTLEPLLSTLMQVRDDCRKAHERNVPLLLKVAPDLDKNEKADIAALVLAYHLDGMIISNTTVSRPPSLASRRAGEQGGLSGAPLFALSTETLKDFYRLTGGRIPLIGVGGVASAQDAYTKIRAGATLVQLYTALVYRGFRVVSDIKTGLAELLRRDGFDHVGQAIGVDAG